jgi:putative addiction module component (TIGR02574 family)
MSALLDIVRAQSRDLPSDEKMLLGMELIDAVWLGESEVSSDTVDQAWDEEIQRRVEEIRSGKVQPVPWEEAVAQINARFGWDK